MDKKPNKTEQNKRARQEVREKLTIQLRINKNLEKRIKELEAGIEGCEIKIDMDPYYEKLDILVLNTKNLKAGVGSVEQVCDSILTEAHNFRTLLNLISREV